MSGWKVERKIGRQTLTIESGRWAKQAHGAVTVRYGDTVILATAVTGPKPEHLDFFPMLVDYREKTSASGKIPGGFFKREGRPTTKETLTMRLIDRPIRPLFPQGYEADLQIMCAVLSADQQHNPDVLSMIGASAALHVSPIPFLGPISAVRVGRIDGEFVLFPRHDEEKLADLDLIVAGSRDAVCMVEAGAKEVGEDVMLDAIAFGHKAVGEMCDMIDELRKQCGKPKEEPAPVDVDQELLAAVEKHALERAREDNFITDKLKRSGAQARLVEDVCEALGCNVESPQGPKWTTKQVAGLVKDLIKKITRQAIVEGRRPDGRTPTEIRPITSEVGVLPRTHGSAVFTRGETQALCTVTLGTSSDEQVVDGLLDEYKKRFMLHYNFPPFSVGEVKPVRGPSRRDIGHGALAERSLDVVMPTDEEFPYTVRLVSDILESNGSSSMATVCGGTLCLMDAGVPIRYPVAGIAMGLIKEGDKTMVLTDIQGAEDHFGDMDFKVAGTQRGITSLQLDIKITGLSHEVMREALEQAREGRIEILRKMLTVLERPRPAISDYAPRLARIQIPTDTIGMVIGPGGKTIRAIQAETGSEIDIEDDGTVKISAPDEKSVRKAVQRVEALTARPEVGKVYDGKVVGLKDFGAFVEILPGQDGLLHISEISDGFVKKVEDELKVGEEVRVKIIAVDDQGRIKLSRKVVLLEEREKAGKS